MPIDIAAQSIGTQRPSCWPMRSEAMAVDPSQVREAMAVDRANGLSVNYDRHGRPEITGRDQRARYMAAHGYYDRNAGFGDRAPQNRVVSRDRIKEIRKRIESYG